MIDRHSNLGPTPICIPADPVFPSLARSDRRLFHLFHPYAPMHVWLKGPGNLKQLITEWYKTHFAFAGSVVWCKRLKITDPQDGPGEKCYKFCFEYTPHGASAPNGGSSSASAPRVLQAGSSFSYLQYL